MIILSEREKTHGDYADVSRVSQHLKTYLHNEAGQMTAQQRESLDMICVKIARIVCGDANNVDHWLDCAGYAHLIVNALQNKNTASRASNVTIMETSPDEETDPSIGDYWDYVPPDYR